jgi:hypothetical protein
MANEFDKYLNNLSDKDKQTIESIQSKHSKDVTGIEKQDAKTSPLDMKPRHDMSPEQTQETIREAGMTMVDHGLEAESGSLSKFQLSTEQSQDQDQSKEQQNDQEQDRDNER